MRSIIRSSIAEERPTQVSVLRRVLLGATLLAVVAAADGSAGPQVVLFFGDSLTSGYGVGKDNAFPARVQARADSLQCSARIVNAGLAGETTAGGLRRVDWILQQPVDVFVLELGGNDGLRGVPLAETERNLQGIIDRVGKKAPAARLVIVGVRLPPNLGPDYTEGFHAIFSRLAKANDAGFIPRLLHGVSGDRQLMNRDGLHPNVAGHRRVAQTVWLELAPLLCGSPADSPGAAQDLERGDTGDTTTSEEADDDGE
jgi:acyl-CoA thioesterase-1